MRLYQPKGLTPARTDGRPFHFLFQALVMVAVVATAVISCAESPDESRTNPQETARVPDSEPFWDGQSPGALSATPYDSLEDWVSYADAVVVVEVVEEAVQPTSPTELPGVYPVGRELTVSILRTIWRHNEEERPPTSFTYVGSVWMVRDGEQYRVSEDGATWPEVGRRYLAPINYDRSEDQWNPLFFSTVFTIAADDTFAAEASTLPAAHALDSKTMEEVEAVIRRTRPDPLAEEFRQLAPVEQFEAVSEARSPTTASLETTD